MDLVIDFLEFLFLLLLEVFFLVHLVFQIIDQRRNIRVPRKNLVEEVLEEVKNNYNEDQPNNINSNYPNIKESFPYNIPPKSSYPKNNEYPPQFNPAQYNNNNTYLKSDNNYPTFQAFNPSQNAYPHLPNNYNPNYPYPNTLFQNNLQFPNQQIPENSNINPQNIPEYQNPQYNPNIPESINNNNYPNNPQNNPYPNNPDYMNNIPNKNKQRPNSVINNRGMPNYTNNIYNINNTSYPSRPLLRFGPSLAEINRKFRTQPQKREKSPAFIPYGKNGRGRCFACDVDCGISRSGNSPNNYDPYMASFKKPRYDVTYYDGNKYGYYQYSSNLIKENN